MSDQEIAAAAWIVACAVLFLAITELPGSAARLTGRLTTAKGPSALLILIAIALVVRLAPTLLLRHANIFDLDSYRAVASVVEKGDDVYRSPVADRYPYFPLQLYVIVGADKLARFSGLPFELLIRLPVLAADVGVVALIWMARQRSVALKNRRECPAAAYAFNPVSTMVIAYGAQFDPIPLLLLLGAVITLLTMAGNRAVVFSAVLLGLAIADKTWPLLLLPLVAGLCRKPVRAVALSAVALSVPMAFAAIYSAWQGTPLDDLIRRPLEYKGVGGRWASMPWWPRQPFVSRRSRRR